MFITPLRSVPAVGEIAAALRGNEVAFWLDSAAGGRYSFVGACPDMLYWWQGNCGYIRSHGGERRVTGHPLEILRCLLQLYAGATPHPAVPFAAGAVGYLGYDLGRFFEKAPGAAADDRRLPELALGFYSSALIIDHQSGCAVTAGMNRKSAQGEHDFWLERLNSSPYTNGKIQKPKTVIWNMSPASYEERVKRALQYIAAGDIYQVNFTQRITLAPSPPPLDLYMALRAINPEPYAAYLAFPQCHLVGASPEEFLRKQGDIVVTKPIKGTRPRGADSSADKRLAAELASGEKDAAELTMIVDLERNDLGKVARIGGVAVPQLAVVETHPHVFHKVATVAARLRSDVDACALLAAVFPGGSITGAPKIRAMEIIDELEPTRRGPYTGACGYISGNGDMLMNIIIRSVVVGAHGADINVGGGIVADSTPAGEYAESLDKAAGLLAAWGLRPAQVAPVSPDQTMRELR